VIKEALKITSTKFKNFLEEVKITAGTKFKTAEECICPNAGVYKTVILD